MSERESFLRAIRANPDDDIPRLIFADWLDEHGEPELAEFVRVQVELEPIHEQLDSPRVRELRERETVLLAHNDADWLGPVADIADNYPAFGPVFRRGLPEMVCLSLDTFLARGGELFDACPTLREVSLFDVNGCGGELAVCPHLGCVEKLEIAEPGYDDDVGQIAALCGAVSAARVRELTLPAVFNPHLIHELGRVIATGWPRWITFVEHLPGSGTNTRAYAAALDQIAGRPVTQFSRPSRGRFPLLGNLGHGLFAGHSGGRAVLAAVQSNTPGRALLIAAIFGADGTLTGEATYPLPGGVASAAEFLETELAFVPGLIRVPEFGTDEIGLSVRLWPRPYVNDYLRYPFDRPTGWTNQAWRERGGVLRRWLHEGRFVIEWYGKDLWADSSGTIFGS